MVTVTVIMASFGSVSDPSRIRSAPKTIDNHKGKATFPSHGAHWCTLQECNLNQRNMIGWRYHDNAKRYHDNGNRYHDKIGACPLSRCGEGILGSENK